jgi:ABC-type transport system substrate-binding protein
MPGVRVRDFPPCLTACRTSWPLLVLACLAPTVRAAGEANSPPAAPPATAAAPTVLRYAFRIAETGFDPAGHLRPLLAHHRGQPVRGARTSTSSWPGRCGCGRRPRPPCRRVSDDFKTWVVRLKRGIFFIDDPVFKGARRELTAADYVYSIKRHFDPRWKSPHLSTLEEDRIIGLDALRKKALTASRSTTTGRSRASSPSTATRCGSGSSSRTRASRTT